ncbi:glycoside hydrolase family 73 protein [Pisciglobus halotolerans]
MVIFFGTLIYLSESVSSPISTNEKKEAFIIRLSGYAQTLQEEYDVLPSISIAQAILESNWGTSDLSVENNNYYGIKGSDPKNTVNMRTKEYVDGEWIEIEAPFRKYDDWRESMKDHALLFVNGTNWNPDQYQTVLEAEDYKEAAVALSKSGYATDPTYPDKLIHLIEQYRLYQYD